VALAGHERAYTSGEEGDQFTPTAPANNIACEARRAEPWRKPPL
jgi:hypothetical protein